MPDDSLPPVLEWRYESIDTASMAVSPTEGDLKGAPTIDSRTIEVERDEARHVLQTIHDRLDERSQYYVIETLVVGVSPYIKADVYCRCAYDEPLDRVLDPEVIVVPGDAIEPVIPNEKRVDEHLEGDDA